MHLENVVIRIGKGKLQRFATSGSGVDHLVRQQGIALRRFGFLYRHIGVKEQTIKNNLAVPVSSSFSGFLLPILIIDLERTALQRGTGRIGFQYLE